MYRIAIFLTLIITGCANYNTNFDCKPSRGVNCTSISKINDMADNGALENNEITNTRAGKKPKREVIKVKDKIPFPLVLPNNLHGFEVQRQPETTMRIWIAPYISAENGFLEAQYVHEVLEPGSWLDVRGP